MGPPPAPIDPNLEAYHAAPTPSIALDQLLITSPTPQQRPYYPKEIHLAANFLQEGQTSSMRPNQLEMTPSLNSYPDPWDPQRVNRGTTEPQLMNQSHTGARQRMHPPGPLAYWDSHPPRSDIDSSSGRHIHDSGYYTQNGTESIFSADLSNHDCQSLPGGMGEVELRQPPIHYGIYNSEPPGNGSTNTLSEPNDDFPFDLQCPMCPNKAKNRSEFKYAFVRDHLNIPANQ